MQSTRTLAGAAGVVTGAVVTRLLDRKTDVVMMLNGALAGLVAITAEPLTPTPGMALVIGSMGSLIMYFGTKFLERMGLDDVVGAIPATHVCRYIWNIDSSTYECRCIFWFTVNWCLSQYVHSALYFQWLIISGRIMKATVGLRIQ